MSHGWISPNHSEGLCSKVAQPIEVQGPQTAGSWCCQLQEWLHWTLHERHKDLCYCKEPVLPLRVSGFSAGSADALSLL